MKLWMLSVFALLAVVPSSEGYRAPLYYGRRPNTFGVVDGVASTQHMPLVNAGGLLLEEDMGYNDRNNYAYYVPQDRYGSDRNLRYADGYDGRSGGRSGYIYGMNEPYRYGSVDNYYTSGRRYGGGGGGNRYNYNNDYYGGRYRDNYDSYDNYYGDNGSYSSYGPYNDGYRRGRRYNNYNNYNRNDGYGYGNSYYNRGRYALPPSGSRD